MSNWKLWGYPINLFGAQWWFWIYNSIQSMYINGGKIWSGNYPRNIFWYLLNEILNSEYMKYWLRDPTWSDSRFLIGFDSAFTIWFDSSLTHLFHIWITEFDSHSIQVENSVGPRDKECPLGEPLENVQLSFSDYLLV